MYQIEAIINFFIRKIIKNLIENLYQYRCESNRPYNADRNYIIIKINSSCQWKDLNKNDIKINLIRRNDLYIDISKNMNHF